MEISKLRQRAARQRDRDMTRSTGKDQVQKGTLLSGLCLLLLWAFACFLIQSRLFPDWESVTLPPSGFFSRAILLLSGLAAAALGIQIHDPAMIRNSLKVSMLCSISMIALALGRLMLILDHYLLVQGVATSGFLLPFACAPIMATLLTNRTVALCTGLWTALALVVMGGGPVTLLAAGCIATVIAAFKSHRARTRGRILQAGFVAGFVTLAGLPRFIIAGDFCWGGFYAFPMALGGVFSGLAAAIVALLVLPLLEHVFSATSDITLLELSDLSHPLLQRMSIEAPGTYHHSALVAQLAQAAAEQIGENALLARVAAYFHDVGKLVKPQYFAENIRSAPNPHDDLPPSISTLVITSHVKEGLTLAAMYKLPEEIRRVIVEHHGTGVVSYFHHKAKKELREELGEAADTSSVSSSIREENFRYAGPKPSSRISAIVALADSVEATCRSLEKPTPAAIEEVVQETVQRRIEDGQLDRCPITFEELTLIKRAFVFSMGSMLHTRIAYPKNENLNKQSSKEDPN